MRVGVVVLHLLVGVACRVVWSSYSGSLGWSNGMGWMGERYNADVKVALRRIAIRREAEGMTLFDVVGRAEEGVCRGCNDLRDE